MQHHRMQPFIVLYLSLVFSCWTLDFSFSPSFSFLLLSVLKFAQAARLFPPPEQLLWLLSPLCLIKFSPDNLRKKKLLCLLLGSIIAPATLTTGFICWRRMTSDPSGSQAGLPLSPAQALFLVAEGAERVFNEIQTLGVRSYRLLKTSLTLTSVTNVQR